MYCSRRFRPVSLLIEVRASRLYSRSIKYILLALFPIILLIIVLAQDGLTVWLGADFARHSTRVLQWLAVGVLANSLAFVPFSFIQGIGRPDLTAKLHLLELPVYLAILFWLIHPFGIVGAAIAWSAAHIFGCACSFMDSTAVLAGALARGAQNKSTVIGRVGHRRSGRPSPAAYTKSDLSLYFHTRIRARDVVSDSDARGEVPRPGSVGNQQMSSIDVLPETTDIDLIRTRPCPNCYLCGEPGELLYDNLEDRLFDAPGKWTFKTLCQPRLWISLAGPDALGERNQQSLFKILHSR